MVLGRVVFQGEGNSFQVEFGIDFTVLSVPIQHFIVESAGKEIFARVGELHITDCLGVTKVGVSAGFIAYDVEEVHAS